MNEYVVQFENETGRNYFDGSRLNGWVQRMYVYADDETEAVQSFRETMKADGKRGVHTVRRVTLIGSRWRDE